MDEQTDAPPSALDAEYTIDDIETLRMVSDPLRLRILESLVKGPHTVKQVAALLQLPPTKLYYHFNQLEERDLIRVVGTRVVSGIIEKSYRTRAGRFVLSRRLLQLTASDAEETFHRLVGTVLDTTREDIQRGLAHGLINPAPEAPVGSRVHLGRTGMALTEAQVLAFHERLVALIAEFDTGEESPPDTQDYGFVFALYPLAQAPPDEEDPSHE